VNNFVSSVVASIYDHLVDQHHITSMTENDEYIYKAIVALNNSGVYLIDHGFYTGAIETLKDSMRFMKELVHTKNTMESHGDTLVTSPSNATRINCSAALQAAWRRKSTIHHHNHEHIAMKRVNVSVMSEHDHPCSVYDHLIHDQAREQTHRFSLCCATIDLLPLDYDESSGSNFDRLQQESALILYNLSIAYRCCAKQTEVMSSATSAAYNQISFQLMEYAYTVLSSVLQSISEQGGLLMDISLNLFSITLLVLHNLHEMSHENLFPCDIHKHAQYDTAYQHVVTALAERFMNTAEEEIQKFLGAAAA
jgi:hypothetical protein